MTSILSLRRSRLSLIFSRTLNGFFPNGSSWFTCFPRVLVFCVCTVDTLDGFIKSYDTLVIILKTYSHHLSTTTGTSKTRPFRKQTAESIVKTLSDNAFAKEETL